MINLDFTIHTSKERQEFVNNYIKERTAMGYTFTQKEIGQMGDYILYGKDSDGTSIVDRKEVDIDTRYGSYKKKRPESLESLMESPTFNETNILTTNIYKKEKPKIDREKDKDIPGIQELWKVIDDLDHRIKVTEGKETDNNIKPFTPQQLYKAKHHLIELRTQQYYLKDSVKPTIPPINSADRLLSSNSNQEIIWDTGDYAIAPLGLYSSCPQRFDNPRALVEKDYTYNSKAKFILDFRKPEHIYQLIESYEDFMVSGVDNPESLLDDIMETLDFYIKMADFNEEKSLILELKKKKIPVLEIRNELIKIGVTHTPNYISTIYKQKICKEISEAAKLHYDMYMEREIDSSWKKCSQCGETKLLDSRVFMRKSRSSDGYNSKCKKCCKINRKKEKDKR